MEYDNHVFIDSIMASIEEKENHQPIVIFGQSGCGKTALMGKLIEVSNNRMPQSIIIYRFLGTSPESSSIHNLLKVRTALMPPLRLEMEIGSGSDLGFRLKLDCGETL